jgi:predicted  nucleic acid-binding Zn-ribbon protein
MSSNVKNPLISGAVAIIIALAASYVGLQTFQAKADNRLSTIEDKVSDLESRKDALLSLNKDVEYLTRFANVTSNKLVSVKEKVSQLELDGVKTTVAIVNLTDAVNELANSVKVSTEAIIRLEEKINK